MTVILGISGSLRAGSLNSALLRAAAGAMPATAKLEIGSIKGIPLYDGDVEATEGIPDVVAKLKERVAAADGVLLVTPEYNNSIPGVFKNAIDWLSRPSADIARVFGGRPFGVIGASPGGFGTLLSQTAWLPVLKTLGTAAYFGGRLQVARAGDAFDASGNLVDERVREQLTKYLKGFSEFVAATRRVR
jgi:NAD(P)H-dependent FMN reductase